MGSSDQFSHLKSMFGDDRIFSLGTAPWIRIRHELFEQLQQHVRVLLGEDDPGLRRYREVFDREMRRSWSSSTRDELFQEIQATDILLLADFHALAQSQRAQLRILKAMDKSQKNVLLMECFAAKHQSTLDQFMAGELTERQFLRKIEWAKNWGFPWDHYRPLLRFAQKHKIPVYALNRSSTKSSLEARDEFAAKLIHKVRRKHSGARMIVIYGDLHLASKHLPQAIRKYKSSSDTIRMLSVFQNAEEIFFKLLEKDEEMSVDVVRFSPDEFCILSVAPWVKWQNYLLFLERHLDRGLDEDDIEYTDNVARYLKLIGTDFGVPIEDGSFSIYTPDDASFWERLQDNYEGPRLQDFKDLIRESKSFYVPELQVGYLARPSVNHAAQLATSIFHSKVSGWTLPPRPRSEDFLRLIWVEAVQYFGSKTINPKRKTDTLQDIRAALASRNPVDLGEEALKLALHQKMSEMLFLTGASSKAASFKPKKAASYREAARLLGGLLGEKLWAGLRKRVIGPDAVLRLLKFPVHDPGFSSFYFELLEIVEGLPEPFLSKADKM